MLSVDYLKGACSQLFDRKKCCVSHQLQKSPQEGSWPFDSNQKRPVFWGVGQLLTEYTPFIKGQLVLYSYRTCDPINHYMVYVDCLTSSCSVWKHTYSCGPSRWWPWSHECYSLKSCLAPVNIQGQHDTSPIEFGRARPMILHEQHRMCAAVCGSAINGWQA